MKSPYSVPEITVCVETEVKRSRFIATLAHISNRAEAMAIIEGIRREYPDARHHCWAFIAGDPNNSPEAGMRDDGEPQGTAGKPIFNVLQHKKVGNILAVVTRYFGGVKLGAGGLVRAYSAAVQTAYEQLPLKEIVPSREITVKIDYPLEKDVRHTLSELELTLIQSAYSEWVSLTVDVPLDQVERLTETLTNVCKGQVHVDD